MPKHGQKHKKETIEKIRISNTGKKFSPERCKAIASALRQEPDERMLEKLKVLWDLRFLNPTVVMREVNVKRRVYKRWFKQYCSVQQVKFMPVDLEVDELKKIIELAKQNVYIGDIANAVDRNKKQIHALLRKMNFKANTRSPSAYQCTVSSLEKIVSEFLNEAGIDFTQQFVLGAFFFDFHIVNSNVLIEVHGDYWHCNPAVYIDGPVNEMHRRMMRRDFCKRDYARKMGFKRLVVWERDLNVARVATLNALVTKIKEIVNAKCND